MSADQQRLDALAIANEIRSARAAWRRWAQRAGKVAALGEMSAIVSDPPEWALNWAVERAVVAIPRVGRVAAAKLLRRLGITAGKRLVDLTPGQRDALAGVLRAEQERWMREAAA